jgi:hypothetical protein
MNTKKWSDEKILEYLRTRTKEVGRTLRVADVPGYVKTLCYERFTSWDNALKLATGTPSCRHIHSDDDLTELLKRIHTKEGRLPAPMDVSDTARKKIVTRFGSFYDALEQTFGTSDRVLFLHALQELTPPQCPEASGQEIIERLAKDGVTFSSHEVRCRMVELHKSGFVEHSRPNRISLWSLSAKGKNFINAKVKIQK